MKKILAVLLALILAFSMIGCKENDKVDENKNQGIEMFESMMKDLSSRDNMSMKSTMSLELEQLTMLGLPSPMMIEMTTDVSSHKNMKMNLAVDLGILPIEADIYVTEDQLMIYSELLGSFLGAPYMSLDLQDLMSQVGETTESEEQLNQLKDILARYEETSEYSLYDVFVFDEKVVEEKITVNEEKIDTNKITMNLTLDKAVDFLYDFMTFAAEDEEARALLLTSMTDEEIDEMKAEMLDPENRVKLEEALAGLTMNSFKIEMYLNKDLAPVKMDLDIDVSLLVEEEVYDLKFKMNQEMFNFGIVEDIQMPDVDPSEVQNLSDMIPNF